MTPSELELNNAADIPAASSSTPLLYNSDGPELIRRYVGGGQQSNPKQSLEDRFPSEAVSDSSADLPMLRSYQPSESRSGSSLGDYEQMTGPLPIMNLKNLKPYEPPGAPAKAASPQADVCSAASPAPTSPAEVEEPDQDERRHDAPPKPLPVPSPDDKKAEQAAYKKELEKKRQNTLEDAAKAAAQGKIRASPPAVKRPLKKNLENNYFGYLARCERKFCI